ncbi:hypothetical protein HDF26_003125 [Pedobacter cryoconitis]|nr:hypothetical protein [Pedobacter cryoconitis]
MAFKATIDFLGIGHILLLYAGFLKINNTIERSSFSLLYSSSSGNPAHFLVPR